MQRIAAVLGVTVGVIAGIALVIAGVYGVGLFTQPHPPTLQGDSLGREEGESWEAYAARSERSAASISKSPSFALVTFETPLSPSQAARTVREAGRVSALLLIDAPFQPIPEPPTGHSRADVFEREAALLAAQGEANGIELDPEAIAAVVVYDDGETLRSIAAKSEVGAVEALPPDAVWGAFAIRPMN